MRRIRIINILIFCIFIYLIGLYTGYVIYKSKKNIENKEVKIAQVITIGGNKITPSTKIIYKYYYPSESKTKIKEELSPYFLIGKTKDEIKNYLPEWNVNSFSEKEVILTKTLDKDSKKHFIVSEYNGNVASFKEKVAKENLIEITSTPVSSLSEEEQKIISEGIVVDTKYELLRCMENYSS